MATLVPQFTHRDANNSTVEHVVDHVVHIASLVGYDHIGLGTDFAGTPWTVPGVDDIAKLPVLVAAMLRRGIARADVEKILGLNVIRVLADVERVARELRSEPALEDVIEPIVED
jgi:membrane dipeptidase